MSLTRAAPSFHAPKTSSGGAERYRRIFEDARVALWDDDFSQLWAFLEQLRRDGVADVRGYFANRSDELEAAHKLIEVRDVNRYSVELFEAANKEELIAQRSLLSVPETMNTFLDLLEALWKGRHEFESETVLRTLKGRVLYVTFTVTCHGDRYENTLVSILDISRHRALLRSYEDLTVKSRMLLANETAERLAAIVESSDDAIISKDLEGRIMSWNSGAARIFGYTADEIIGQPVTILMPPERRDEEPGILARIRAGERIEHYETVRQRKDGSLLDISLTVSPIRDMQGNVVGASKIARDITQRKRAEKHRELLIGELSHRVKNTLATVLSIERLSLVSGYEEDPGRETFRARILALAHAHTRLAESSWLSASLSDLIADELLPYIVPEQNNVTLAGQPVMLNPRCALSISLAFHELATNAAKYGSLSSSQGRVEVSWQVRPGDGVLEIEWNEAGGPPVIPPRRIGFGRMLLEQALGQEIGSTVTMEFPAEGLKCTISIPRSEYDTLLN